MAQLGSLLCLLVVLAGSFDETSAHFRSEYDTPQAYASTKRVEDWDVTHQYPNPGRPRWRQPSTLPGALFAWFHFPPNSI
jgi:hypothetical protein